MAKSEFQMSSLELSKMSGTLFEVFELQGKNKAQTGIELAIMIAPRPRLTKPKRLENREAKIIYQKVSNGAAVFTDISRDHSYPRSA